MLAAAVRPICLAAGLTPGTGVVPFGPWLSAAARSPIDRDLGMAGQAQVGRDDDAAGAVERGAAAARELGAERRAGDAGRPDHGARGDPLAAAGSRCRS